VQNRRVSRKQQPDSAAGMSRDHYLFSLIIDGIKITAFSSLISDICTDFKQLISSWSYRKRIPLYKIMIGKGRKCLQVLSKSAIQNRFSEKLNKLLARVLR
jgi:hypothetical protein